MLLERIALNCGQSSFSAFMYFTRCLEKMMHGTLEGAGLCIYKGLHSWWHIFAHLPEMPLNPRMMACFGDEDFVRRLCNIAPCSM